MQTRPHAPATRRNRDSILEVLTTEFETCSAVLEIGSGTGEHAVYFARHLPHLTWQPSDRPPNLAGISAWVDDAALENVPAPIPWDVLEGRWPRGAYDAVFSANTAHIMSERAVEAMFAASGSVLRDGGKFALYGPFNLGGKPTSESNRQFDESLRARDPAMGIRDLEWLDEIAMAADLRPCRRYAMPSNNMISVWRHE